MFRSTAVRALLGAALALGLLLAFVRALGSGTLERADFAFNNGAEVTSLDPATITGVPEGRVIRALFEGLCVKHPRTLEPLPGAAESWEVAPDGLRYVFRIRAGAQWTNGDPLTAHDFAFSFERLLDPRTAAEFAYLLWCVRGARAFSSEVDARGEPLHSFASVGIAAPDERTLVIELEQPVPYFLHLVSFYCLFPVNRRNLEQAQREFPASWRIEWLRPERIVTNGPFRIAERRVNDRIRLVKNELYWDRENVALRSIDAYAIEHIGTALNLYLTGELDHLERLPPAALPQLAGREDFQPVPYLGTYFFRVNTQRPPLDDARVRRALALAIDRAEICRGIASAGEFPHEALVPAGMPGYRSPRMRRARLADERAAFARDCDEARALLAEAGYAPGSPRLRTLELHYNSDSLHRDIAEFVASTWKRELGLDTLQLNQEWKVYLDSQTNLEYDVSRASWIGDYPDPNNFLEVFVTGGENNKTGWSNAQYDAWLAQAAAERDPAARLELLARAEEVLLEELPILPVFNYVTKNLVAPRLGGFEENLQDEHFPKFLYWMDDEELAQRRARLPSGTRLVDPHGPRAGLYAPAAARARAAR